ncbi:unnamed protein product [Fusarium graminearum]|uniref:Uncharacterized protein n=1 Tax=Gibberella zeae TaxID=5518 RepID=A0A4U9EWG5_GIBZA|nr:unnamed protein product [Fusarium graminearum]CAG1970558.1 unnamed protein product [Fusarium graminearum]CAG1982602.1 unnamed protein product [Fusarium graminearum]VTO86862.1 unnamed protein product [Fusarium graminearum]
MASELSPVDVRVIAVIQQVCSVLSIIGCLFIIGTFCLCDAFHKPINRLVFYASFGNMIASICFILADSFVKVPEGTGCQAQAFLIHTFVAADAMWTFAMSVNVYLAFYHRFDAQRLRRMELPYLLACYGVPFLPAFVFIFIKDENGFGVYGNAVQWCWIAPKWGNLRIATFYGPIWFVIIITLGIYIRSGGTIYRKRRQLLKAHASGSGSGSGSGSRSGNLSYNDQRTTNYMKTTEVTVIHEPIDKPEAVLLHILRPKASIRVFKPTIAGNAACPSAEAQPNIPRPPTRSGSDVYKATWAYTKVAMLFFAVILITWIPSSANRMYSFIHPHQVSKPLQFMSATVLPLQGFWNAVIYAVTSKDACKAILEERGLRMEKTRLNEPTWDDEQREQQRNRNMVV